MSEVGAALVVELLRSNRATRRWTAPETITIGTAPGMNIRVRPGQGVEDHHATVHLQDGRPLVVAVDGSVLHGGRSVRSLEPRPDDEVQLGQLRLRIRVQGANQASSTSGSVAPPAARTTEASSQVDDEDYDEELDFVPPFDLVRAILGESGPAPSRPGSCAATVLKLADGQVVHSTPLLPGESFALPSFSCRCEKGKVVVVVSPPMKGAALLDEEVRIRSLPIRDGARTVTLGRGQCVVIWDKSQLWRINAYKPPPTPILPRLLPALGKGLVFVYSLCFALMTHLVLGVGLNVMVLTAPEPEEFVAALQEEMFADVEMPLKEAPEEPLEVRQRQETLSLAEKVPPVTRDEVVQVQRQSPSESPSVSSLLTRLATADSSGSLSDQISTIEAVAAAPDSATAFDLAGRLAAGDGVQVARKGSGVVSTAGQVQDNVGQLDAGGRAGVRGRVTKLASRMKVQGTIEREEISRVVNAHINQIQACYERAMIEEPSLAGRIVFDWTITTSGSVRAVRVNMSTMPSTAVPECIRDHIKTWQFARPTGGEAVISYPFAFRGT